MSEAPAQQDTPARVPNQRAFDPRQRSPVLASLLSLMPGLGQVYVGYYQQGFAHVLVVASLIAILAAELLKQLTPLVAMFLVFFWLHNIIDAGRRAALVNEALPQGEGYEPIRLPADVLAPGVHGSLIGGTLLVAVGFMLLLNTRFDVSLDWIEDWWPAAPMVLGLYLIFLAIHERRALAV